MHSLPRSAALFSPFPWCSSWAGSSSAGFLFFRNPGHPVGYQEAPPLWPSWHFTLAIVLLVAALETALRPRYRREGNRRTQASPCSMDFSQWLNFSPLVREILHSWPSRNHATDSFMLMG